MTSSATITDYLTGVAIPDVGAESHRQALIRFLVEEKGYSRDALWVDAPLHLVIAGAPYRSRIDVVVKAGDPLQPYMAIKCCAGSLGSREREIVAAARVFGNRPIPLAVVSDGRKAIVLDTFTGKVIADRLSALVLPSEAAQQLAAHPIKPLTQERREREKLIFRTYDLDNVNIVRPAGKA
ncbi:MAG: type I restriction enzyme HsdR N-terminal domain-containing protein [Desulfobacterales bacterium]|jgi:hypothetical protein